MDARSINSVSEAQAFLNDLYPNADRDFSYIFGYCARHIGYLCKSLNSSRGQKLDKDEFFRSVSWLLAIANKLELDLQRAMILRHPCVCPYCLTRPCDCISTGKQPKIHIRSYDIPHELASKADVVLRDKKVTFDCHIERLREIYPGNRYVWQAMGAWFTTSKMQEELSEVHEATTRFLDNRRNKDSVGEELSDLLGWILSAWDIASDRASFDDEFKAYYMKGCPVCEEDECTCELFGDKSSRLIATEKVAEIETLLLDLAREAGLEGCDIEEVKASLEKARSTNSQPVAKKAITEAKQKTFELEKSLENGAKNTKNAASLIKALKDIFEAVQF